MSFMRLQDMVLFALVAEGGNFPPSRNAVGCRSPASAS